MFNMPGTTELLIIGGIALVIFGPKRLPQMGRAVGDTIRELRNARKELAGDDKEDDDAA